MFALKCNAKKSIYQIKKKLSISNAFKKLDIDIRHASISFQFSVQTLMVHIKRRYMFMF